MGIRAIVALLSTILLFWAVNARNSDYWVTIQITLPNSKACSVTIQEGKNSTIETREPQQKFAFTPKVIDKQKGLVDIDISSVSTGDDGKEKFGFIEKVKANTQAPVSTTKTTFKFGFLITKIGEVPGVCTP